ncbi:MAG: hypothetical protein WCJ11_12485 [Methylococcaceae bacterium]
MKTHYSIGDIQHAALLAMQNYSIAPNHIELNKLVRFHVDGDAKGSKNGWYNFHSDGLPAGAFGCFKRAISENWCIKSSDEFTDQDRAEFAASMKKIKIERENTDAAKNAAAQKVAERRIANAKLQTVDMFATADDAPEEVPAVDVMPELNIIQAVEIAPAEIAEITPALVENTLIYIHPYLLAKNVKNHGCLFEGENLLIPACDVFGTAHTIQTIAPNGDKRFQAGGAKKGNFHLLGKEIEKNGFNQLIVLTEGYATGATCFEALGEKTPVAVCFDSGNLEPVALALRKHYPRLRILVAGDNDAFKEGGNSGKEKAQSTVNALVGGAAYCLPDFTSVTKSDIQAAMLASQGTDVDWGTERSAKRKQQIVKLTDARLAEYQARKPTDYNDLAQWLGVARVKMQLQKAIDSIGSIKIEGGKLPQILKKIEGEMIFYSGNLYQRAGVLVRPIHDQTPMNESGIKTPANALTIHAINTAWLVKHFTTVAKWQRYNPRLKDFEAVDAESKYAEIYLASVGEWRLPVLRGIVECPTLRSDGTLILKSGYDRKSGLFVDYQGEPVYVIDNPTRDDALAALALLKQPLKDFPFLEEIDRSVILAAMLTAVVRRSVSTSPMFAIDAPIMGSGKSLLSDMVAMLATGRKAIVVSQGRDEAEDEKRFGALLMRGVPLINLDNIERAISGEMLCSMLTQEQVSARVLGQSTIMDLPTNITILATGNNLTFKGDMVRRVLLARLDPQCERPDARKFDVDLNEWIPANRHRLLGAVLTILRAYIYAGKPKQDITAYGSFDEWNNLIRASLVWLDVADPMKTRERIEESDPIKQTLGSVLSLWHAAYGSQGKTAAEVAHNFDMNSDLRQVLLDVAVNKRGDNIDPKRLGQWVKRFLNRVQGGLRFEKAGVDGDSKVIYWKVAKVTGITGITGIKSNPNAGETNKKSFCSEGVSMGNDTRDTRDTRKNIDNSSGFDNSDIEEF